MYLLAALFFSTILLVAAIHEGRRATWPAVSIALYSFGLFIVPIVLMTQLLVVGLQGLFLFLAGLAVSWQKPPRRFAAIAIGATALAYVIVGYGAYRDLRELQKTFPVESMEARLPRTIESKTVQLSAEAKFDLDHVEGESRSFDRRAPLLQMLHENTVRAFAEQPGFGFSRMSGMASLHYSNYWNQAPDTPATEAPNLAALSAQAPVGTMTEVPDQLASMRLMHNLWVPEFLEPPFGYFADRRHVVGFVAHRVREEPYFAKPKARKVELVGLVVHAEPVVYMSQGLPSMKDLAKTPLRPLDEFETKGVAALESGEPLFVRRTMSDLRALGAIRATKTCVECHGCERGQLLGAFSYRIDDRSPAP